MNIYVDIEKKDFKKINIFSSWFYCTQLYNFFLNNGAKQNTFNYTVKPIYSRHLIWRCPYFTGLTGVAGIEYEHWNQINLIPKAKTQLTRITTNIY